MSRICSYLELRGVADRSGIGAAVRNHVSALVEQGFEVTSDPRQKYDLLHLHWPGTSALRFARRARRAGRPIVLSVHTLPQLIRGACNFSGGLAWIYLRYMRWFVRYVDLLIAPSPFAAELLRPIAGRTPVHVVSSGVDDRRFRFSEEKRSSFRVRHGLERPTVLSVGCVIPSKGVTTLLDVAGRLPEVDFLWAGPRFHPFLHFSPRFERALRRAPENVRFLGFVAGIEEAYCGCDVLFHPSLGESLGLVILEAAAVGLRPVVRRLPVYRDWLEDTVDCLMGDDVPSLADAIERLTSEDPPQLSVKRIVRGHRLHDVGERLSGIYRELLT